MTPWAWTVFELMTFPFDSKMIDLARDNPTLTTEQLEKKTYDYFIAREPWKNWSV